MSAYRLPGGGAFAPTHFRHFANISQLSQPRRTSKVQQDRPQSIRLTLLLLALLVASGGGCSRAFYRRMADLEVYTLISRGSHGPKWELDHYGVEPAPQSRMHGVGPEDCPPQPPDDPLAAALLKHTEGPCGERTWAKYGHTPFVANPAWMDALPRTEDGEVLLDSQTVVHLARLNSPRYQSELEDLYFSALDVTFQRFRFDSQFFGGLSTFFTADGPDRTGDAQSTLAINSDMARILEWNRRLAGGGELVVGLANSLVWQFAGPDEYTASSLLDFSLVQPLLRGAGRAIVLEELTQSQRDLLANIRQMVRYRRAFYVQTIAGRSAGAGPAPGGLSLAGLITGTGGAAGGLLGLLEQEVRIRNQRANVAGLRESLEQLDAAYEAGRIDRFQVDLARQALYSAQSRLITLRTQYQDRLDDYKIELGLPPGLPADVDDPLLRPFDLIDPVTTEAQDVVAEALLQAAQPDEVTPEQLATTVGQARRQAAAALAQVEEDMARLDEALPRRRANLRRLSDRPELTDGEVEQSAVDLALLEERIERLRADYERVTAEVRQTLDELASFDGEGFDNGAIDTGPPTAPTPDDMRVNDALGNGPVPGDAPDSLQTDLVPPLRRLSRQMGALSLVEARARLDTVTLVPVEMGWQRAVQTARENRLDWMNARSALVDRWRQIELAADDLRGDLDVTFSGDMGTLDDNPVQFRATTGRLRVGLEFDAPLTRLVERNAYREVLIDYQRARREFYTFEDRVSQSLRATLRAIVENQLNFELQRQQVLVAIAQVELTQLRLQRPPRPGEDSQFGATTARDLVQALSGLLSAQNQFLSVWVDYEVQRLNLDLDLGTMRLDDRGIWIDPGEIVESEGDGRDGAGEAVQPGLPGRWERESEQLLPPDLEPIPTPPGAPLGE